MVKVRGHEADVLERTTSRKTENLHKVFAHVAQYPALVSAARNSPPAAGPSPMQQAWADGL